MQELERLLIEAVKKRLKDMNLGLLFSGGVDSSTLAIILKKLGKRFTCYTAGLDEEGLKGSEDVKAAGFVARSYGLDHRIITIGLDETERLLPKIVKIIGSTNVIKVGVALPFYLAMEKAAEDGVQLMLSGLGSEEIFAGYERHRKADDINEECRKGLLEMHHRDLVRDYSIAKHFGIELMMPYLDPDVVKHALDIPGEEKITEEQSKLPIRNAAIRLGLSEEYAMRKKMGAQYGSRFDRAIEKLARRSGFSKKSDYLDSLAI